MDAVAYIGNRRSFTKALSVMLEWFYATSHVRDEQLDP